MNIRQRNRIARRSRRPLLAEKLEDRRLLAGPYAPAADQPGSTAISKDDAAFAAWATGVANYTPGSDVDAEFQTPDKSLGPAEGTVGDVVSLGRGGQITLTFDAPIRDGLGFDFAVFENALSDTFLELGFVEVSSDGINFFRFDNDSLTPAAVGAFGAVDPTEINNYAGKYRQGFGTPFDLQQLSGAGPLLDTTRVTHVRVIDVVGDGSQADTSGDPIFDPFPTVGSAGLDLDAVAVIHQAQFAGDIVGLEDVGAGLSAESAFRGPDPQGNVITGPFEDSVVVGSFQSETLSFNNAYSIDFESWTGWAYSNATNTTTPGFMNQFSSFADGGADGSPTFAIAFPDQSNFFGPSIVTRDPADTRRFESLMVTNTTYTALSMRDGDLFAKKFGGPSGDDPDFLLLTISGKDISGGTLGTIDFYLADYRFADNSLDYIVDTWEKIDLNSIATAHSLELTITSSDVGENGLNTPAFVAVDDIALVQPVLHVDIADHEVVESAGPGASVVRISRPSNDTTGDIVVSLAPVDANVAAVPDSVTISAGQPFVEFPIDIVNNEVFDGQRQITIDASAAGFIGNARTLTIQDDEQRLIGLSLDQSTVTEGSIRTATVTRNDADLSQPLSVQIDAGGSSLVSFNSVVVIRAGDASATVAITAVEDEVDRANAQVSITASAGDYMGSTVPLQVIDNDQPSVSIELDAAGYRETDAAPSAGLEDAGKRLAPESFYNGADQAGRFVSEAVTFNNNFDPMFGSWAGWSYSNTTDTVTAGFTNQYSALAGMGSNQSDTYAVAAAFSGAAVPAISRDPATSESFQSIDITNTTYAALSMMQGDDFAKKFGGASGDDPDFFLLTIEGHDAGGAPVGTIDFYLADFRSADNAQDYIVDQWTRVDVSSLSDAVELKFSLTSSDVGSFGMNTPAYFALDNVVMARSSPSPTITVGRNTEDVSQPLEVSLSSSDTTVVTLADLATIPAGASSVSVPLAIVDDAIVDGNQTAVLTVTAAGHGPSSKNITVSDDDSPELTLSVLTPTIDEADGEGQAIVHRNVGNTTASLSVDLSAALDNQILLPTPVTIPIGARSVSFTFTAQDNSIVDEDRVVSMEASADGFASDQDDVLIVNDDQPPPTLTLQFDRTVLSEADAPPTISWEDIGATIAEESFHNGSDLTGGFASGQVQLNNTFDPTFGIWGGWSISNTTDTTTAGFQNQYSAITGIGAADSPTYAIASAFPGGTVPTVSLADPDSGQAFESLMVTNATYAALSMAQGDDFAKKFGGQAGDDPDFFLLTIEGQDREGQSVGSVEFPLADFRFADNSLDYIVDRWTRVDVSGLVGATSLQFSLTSSDVGEFGMNTPAYFAVDQIILSDVQATTARATISRSDADVSQPLLVRLSSEDATEVSHPSTVTIPGGSASATFDIRAADDFVVDGDQTSAITAAAVTHTASSASLTIQDDDDSTLTLSVSRDLIDEPDGVTATKLLVHRNTQDTSSALTIQLSATGNDIQIPAPISIPAGKSSHLIDLGVTDNQIREGDRIVRVDGSADGFASSLVELTVIDNEVAGINLAQSGGATLVGELFGQDDFQVSLSSQPLSDVVVDVGLSSSDVTVDHVRLIFHSGNWDQTQFVTLSGVPDLLLENDETVVVTLSVDADDSDSFFASAADAVLNVVVQDYQPATLRLGEDDSSLFLLDAESGVRISEGTRDGGIQVVANDLQQTIAIDPLPQSSGLLVQVDASGGDDAVILAGTQFTSVDGGQGYDRLVLNLDHAVDLVDFAVARISGFEELVLASDAKAELAVDLQRLGDIVSDDDALLIRVDADQLLKFVGDGFMAAPTMVGDDFAQVIQSGRQGVHLIRQTPWQNGLSRWDVNRSGDVTSLDALIVVNQLTRVTDAELPPLTAIEQFGGSFFDVNGDGKVTALDALQVINEVGRRFLALEAELIVSGARAEDDSAETSCDPRSRIEGTPAPRKSKIAVAANPHDIAIRQLDSDWLTECESDETESLVDLSSLDLIHRRH